MSWCCPTVRPALPSICEVTEDAAHLLRPLVDSMNTSLRQQLEMNKTNLLPATALPTFKGEYAQYGVFRNAFRWAVEENNEDPQRRLTLLHNHLEGPPKDLIEGCRHLPADQGYPKAWAMLNAKYDSQDELVEEYIAKLFAWKDIQANDYEALEKYHAYLFRVMCALGDNYVQLELTDTMRKLIGKLPYHLRCKFVAKHERHKFALPALIEFVQQQVKTARLMKHPEGAQAPAKTTSKPEETSRKAPLPVHAAHLVEDDCYHCGKKAHQVPDCHQFKRLSTEARWSAVRPTRLCFRCLRGRHDHRVCPESSVCGKCGRPEHHTLLHHHWPVAKSTGGGDRTRKTERAAVEPAPEDTDRDPMPEETTPPEETLPVSTITDLDPAGSTMLKLLPVVVENAASTYAFIDGGAAPSLITRDLVMRLGLKGKKCRQLMQTEFGVFLCDEVIQLKVSNLDGDQDITIDEVFVTPKITVTTDHLMPAEWMKRWDHMADVKLDRLPDGEASVGVIVGLNTSLNWRIMGQRQGGEGEPSAHLTKLGWVAFGPTGPHLRTMVAPVHHVRPAKDTVDILRASRDRDS